MDLTGRTCGGLLVLGRAGTDRHRAPIWRVRCIPCGREYNTAHTSVVKAPAACRTCTNRTEGQAAANRNIRSGLVGGPTGRLYQHIWPKVCRTCGQDFHGTARQVYCRVKCRSKQAK